MRKTIKLFFGHLIETCSHSKLSCPIPRILFILSENQRSRTNNAVPTTRNKASVAQAATIGGI